MAARRRAPLSGRPGCRRRRRSTGEQAPVRSAERLSPPAKFGDFVPTVAQLIAHDSGFLRAQMSNEMRAFSHHLLADAYQATLDRSRFIMRDSLPLNAAA